ncbi:MAG: hypothetical protein ACRD15_10625 [Vicinamibacterales bacterium]
MTKADFLQWLGESERDFPVAAWTAHGVRVWPIVRLQLLAQNANASVLQDAVGGGARRNAAAVARVVGTWAAATARDWRHNTIRLRRADAVFLAYSSGNQPTIDGRRYNPLLAPYVHLLQRTGRTAAVWEMCHEGEYNIPRSIPSAFIQPQLLAHRIASLFMYRPNEDDAVVDGFRELVARARAAGLVNRYTNVRALLRDTYFVRRTADWFKRRLAIVGPSHGFVADYGLREQAFCLACRELGIPSVELQHGVINDTHPAYAGWQAVPVGGYESRPALFWCWDATGVAAIERWAARAPGGARAVLGGDPWREQWRQDDAVLVRAFDERIATIKEALPASAHVLVTLDPTGAVVPDILIEAMRRSPAEWCYWVRLHPLGQRARLPDARRTLDANRIRCAPVHLSSEWPLHAVLRHVDAHVTGCWSTVVMEAEDFGVSSVACAERAREVFPQQMADGTLRIAATPDELLTAVALQIRNRRPRRAVSAADPERALRDALSTAPRRPTAPAYPAAS